MYALCIRWHTYSAFGHLSTFGADVHTCTPQGQLQKNWSGKVPLTCQVHLESFSYCHSHMDHSCHSPHHFGYGAPIVMDGYITVRKSRTSQHLIASLMPLEDLVEG